MIRFSRSIRAGGIRVRLRPRVQRLSSAATKGGHAWAKPVSEVPSVVIGVQKSHSCRIPARRSVTSVEYSPYGPCYASQLRSLPGRLDVGFHLHGLPTHRQCPASHRLSMRKRRSFGETSGEPASEVFRLVGDEEIYRFDQTCRVTAIREAVRLGIDTRLHLNFMPNAVYDPENCTCTTLAAEGAGLALRNDYDGSMMPDC